MQNHEDLPGKLVRQLPLDGVVIASATTINIPDEKAFQAKTKVPDRPLFVKGKR